MLSVVCLSDFGRIMREKEVESKVKVASVENKVGAMKVARVGVVARGRLIPR